MAVALIALATTPAASAHSVLIATEPANDSVLETSPEQVLLRFDEGVSTSVGQAIRVFDSAGNRVDEEEIERPSRREVVIGLKPDLPNGTYTVAWRLISADSDPISGAFVFHVGERGASSAVSLESLTATPASVSIPFTAGRFFNFAFLLLSLGGTAALVIALPSCRWEIRRRLYGILAGLATLGAVTALLNIFFQGAAGGGLSLGDAFTWDVFQAVLDTRYGKMMLIQAALGATLALTAIALRTSRSGDQRPLLLIALALGIGMSVTPSLSGHASTQGALAFLADWAHVISAAMWTGGLGFVVLALLFSGTDRWPLATRAVPRFSTMAVVSVTTLLIAGTINGYLQVRTWSSLWETRYGLLLLGKIALVIPLLGLGAYNNRYAVPRLKAGIASVLERRRFLSAAGAELAIMVAIVAVTAVLVNAEPAYTEAAGGHMEGPAMATGDHGPFEKSVQLEGTEVMVTVDPAMPGENTVSLTFMPEPQDLTEVSVAASLPSQNIGPLDFTAERDPAQHGMYVIEKASFTIAGHWELRLKVLIGQFDLLTETIEVPIGVE
ncbi:MAG: copper resistance CopC/CopD family protein [Gaiellaceae bacterium]